MPSFPIFDGHNDVLSRLHRAGGAAAFFRRNRKGHLDFPRACRGGFAGGFFAVFVRGARRPPKGRPWPRLPHEEALRETAAMAGLLAQLARTSRGDLSIVRTFPELARCLAHRRMAAILHFEGAEAIDPELRNLEFFHRAGLRSLSLTWSRPNAFAHGAPFGFPGSPDQGPGLTRAGLALVRACNPLGIMLDVSHLNEKGFWDVARTSRRPLVATHSNAWALCRSPRNLTDRQLDAVKASEGVVGVNFYTGFLREDGQGDPRTPLAEIVRHVDYLLERLGPRHVALGSDFDGATIPRELKDVSGLPRLVEAFRRQGYSRPLLKRLLLTNWLRVLKDTWRPSTY